MGFFFVWTGDGFRPWVVEDDDDCGFSGGCLVAVVVVSALGGCLVAVVVVSALGLISFMMCVKVVTKFFNFALMKI